MVFGKNYLPDLGNLTLNDYNIEIITADYSGTTKDLTKLNLNNVGGKKCIYFRGSFNFHERDKTFYLSGTYDNSGKSFLFVNGFYLYKFDSTGKRIYGKGYDISKIIELTPKGSPNPFKSFNVAAKLPITRLDIDLDSNDEYIKIYYPRSYSNNVGKVNEHEFVLDTMGQIIIVNEVQYVSYKVNYSFNGFSLHPITYDQLYLSKDYNNNREFVVNTQSYIYQNASKDESKSTLWYQINSIEADIVIKLSTDPLTITAYKLR